MKDLIPVAVWTSCFLVDVDRRLCGAGENDAAALQVVLVTKGVIAVGGRVGPRVGLVLFEFPMGLFVVWAKRRLVHSKGQLEDLVDGQP
jgi:hypothetical protein